MSLRFQLIVNINRVIQDILVYGIDFSAFYIAYVIHFHEHCLHNPFQ
jgi:hypothetical protein